MHNRLPAVKAILVAMSLLLVFVSSCKKDPCEDEICQPCPSSRVVFQYQDSSGGCIPSFHSSARVYALHSRTADTLYSYSFSDSCTVGFLVTDSTVYHLVSTAHGVNDVISFDEKEYQDPIEVTECCLCYPVSHIHGKLNGQTLHVEFPAGQYENTPFIRTL
ncbi:MAG: hypothetical protein U0176_06125 [Bacteroidia bacterium]